MDTLNIGKIYSYLRIADAATIADILISTNQVNWTPGHSARVQADKLLSQLAATNQIEKCKGFYRTLDCKSNYDTHAKKLTQDLASLLKKFPDSIIYREHTIEAVGLRPDAIILVREGGGGLCAIYECVKTERPEYLEKKKNAWASWEGALPYLTKLFGYQIPTFTFTTNMEDLCQKKS
jgi:hypothetical protein